MTFIVYPGGGPWYLEMSDADYDGSKTFSGRDMFLASALYDGLEDYNISHLKIILQKRDANPNVILPKQGISPFHLAIGNESEDFAEEVTRLFLQYGGNPNARSVDKQTPVHIAAAWGRENILHLLLLNGGDPWLCDSDGNNAFDYAHQEQHWNVVDVLQRFWLTISCKEDDSNEEKYILTFEKVFVYSKNVAYEYRAGCTSQTASVTTQNCTSSNSIPWFARNGLNHQESVVKEKNTICHDVSTQTYQNCSSLNTIPEIVINDCAEKKLHRVDTIQKSFLNQASNTDCIAAKNKPCRLDVIQKSVRKGETNADGIAVKKQMHAVTPKCEEESLKKRWQEIDLKTKLLDELKKFHSSSSAKRIPCNSKDTTSAECIETQILGHSCPENSSERSLNIGNKNERAPLNSVKKLKTGKADGLQVVGDTISKTSETHTEEQGEPISNSVKELKTPKADGLQVVGDTISKISETHTEEQEEPLNSAYSAINVRLPQNIPVIQSDTVTYGKSHNICGSLGSSAVKRNRVLESKRNDKINDDRITEYCGVKQRHGFDRICTFDILSPELICEEEWLASQSCFVVSESTDYVTCDDDCPVVKVPDLSAVDVHQRGLGYSNYAEINSHNLRGKTCPSTTASELSSLSVGSYVSVSEEYKYSDEEGGVILLERRFLVPPVSISDLQSGMPESEIVNPLQPSSRLQYEACDTGQSTTSDISIPSSLDYDTDVLRDKLKERGYVPGPIIPTTKRLYLRQLLRLQRKPVQLSAKTKVYSPELQRTVHDNFNWQKWLPEYLKLEKEVAQQFAQPDPLRRWREGVVKSSFTYLLLDPRVTDNLPCRADPLNQSQIWSTFLSSVFYIGKGKRSRPYSHLYQAFGFWNKKTVEKSDKKVHYILDIWKAGMGVVCLHVFQNVIPVEAYTREAAMIDALGLQNLKNARCGEYYGVAATWTSRQKRMLGTYLLYRAMCIFLHEGERQLRPGDIG